METPKDLKEALKYLGQVEANWLPLAGGTDLMVLMESGALAPCNLLNLWGIQELKKVQVSSDWVSIGALATYTEILEQPQLQKEFPLLCRASEETGAVAIQNRGTLGGNLMNASPAADSPPALFCYDASLELTSSQGSRVVALTEFYKGYKKLDRKLDELLTRVLLPRKRGWTHSYYRKVGNRNAQAISKVCVAVTGKLKQGTVEDIRIGLGSVAATSLRAFETEFILRGSILNSQKTEEACARLTKEIHPIDDIRSNAAYRKQVSANCLRECLEGWI